MAIKISQLPDELVVDSEIKLRVKTKENYEEFVEIAKANQEHLADWLPWAAEIPNEGSFIHYDEARARKEKNEAADWNIYFNGDFAGAIGLMNRDPNVNVLEIGYWLAKDFTGKAIMQRSVAKVVDLAFEQTNTPAIEIACDEGNPASAKVATANGFVLVSSKQQPPQARKETGVHQVYRRPGLV